MSTFLLQQAGSAIGGALGGPIGAFIGGAIGAAAGAAIDTSIINALFPLPQDAGPRLLGTNIGGWDDCDPCRDTTRLRLHRQ